MSGKSNTIDIDKSDYKIRLTPSGGRIPNFDEKCLYSVSVGAHGRTIDENVMGYRWAARTFSSCTVLVGDSLYPSTLQIIEGISEPDAILKAEYQSKLTLNEFNARIQDLSPPNIIRTRDIIETSEFYNYFETIAKLYCQNGRFADSVNEDAQWFVMRQARKSRLRLPMERAINKSIFYIKQEIAVYLFLAERGYLIDVYLGREIPTLAKIMTEEIIGGVQRALADRINISLERRVSSRKSTSRKELVAAFALI